MAYKIATTRSFDRAMKKLAKKDAKLTEKVIVVLTVISENPFHHRLQTHKAQTRVYGIAFSSRVTGDIRIIWDFLEDQPVIIALSVGGHSGKRAVYK